LDKLLISQILQIDQPVGTGFSFADKSADYVTNEVQVAEDIWEFLQQFFAGHPQYANLAFYIFGESYAGHYIPAIGQRIVQSNQKGQGNRINLKGMGIGNGFVDPPSQYRAYAEFLYQNKLLDYVSTVAYNDTVLPACEAAIASGLWPVALDVCNLGMQGVLSAAEAEIKRTIVRPPSPFPQKTSPMILTFFPSCSSFLLLL
jgi:carboxypeptidase C (cathepsin A)